MEYGASFLNDRGEELIGVNKPVLQVIERGIIASGFKLPRMALNSLMFVRAVTTDATVFMHPPLQPPSAANSYGSHYLDLVNYALYTTSGFIEYVILEEFLGVSRNSGFGLEVYNKTTGNINFVDSMNFVLFIDYFFQKPLLPEQRLWAANRANTHKFVSILGLVPYKQVVSPSFQITSLGFSCNALGDTGTFSKKVLTISSQYPNTWQLKNTGEALKSQVIILA